MRLIAFNFQKIIAEKFLDEIKNLKIETSINLNSIEEIKKNSIKTKDTFLKIKFNYEVSYNPKIAKIDLGGTISISIDSKKGREVLKDWKFKKLKEEFRLSLFNGILMKSNLKAIQLEDEIGLPLHFRLPSLKSSTKEK